MRLARPAPAVWIIDDGYDAAPSLEVIVEDDLEKSNEIRRITSIMQGGEPFDGLGWKLQNPRRAVLRWVISTGPAGFSLGLSAFTFAPACSGWITGVFTLIISLFLQTHELHRPRLIPVADRSLLWDTASSPM